MSPVSKIRREMLEVVQDEMIMRDRIAELLTEGPKTIPELAEALDYPTHEVTVWLFGMRRYGAVEETGRPDLDGYVEYELVKEEPEAE